MPNRLLFPCLLLGALLLVSRTVSAQVQSAGDPVANAADNLRPGDVLRLRIWREPDLSGDFPVDTRGTVVLPKLGPWDVASVDSDSLQPWLVRAYSEFLNNPSIEVVPLRRISVLGAVQKPGVYPVDPTMTVADVVALAGGASPEGKRDRVELRRGDERVSANLQQASRVADSPIHSGDQLYVPQRSWLGRNSVLVAGLVGTAASLAIALGR
ncbi:MAG TPA: SLBB domain-containing protein [Gemmatimonadales bacterium]|nr:SLBB domain-containing protein [Gemmatimonadales bacterium]